MSELRTNKLVSIGNDLQFWTGGNSSEKLRIDSVGNLCFGASGSAGAHIPPHEGNAPMYSARAWGRINTDATTGSIQADSVGNNIDFDFVDSSTTRWLSNHTIKIVFKTPMIGSIYSVVANCSLNANSPLLVCRASTTNANNNAIDKETLYLSVYKGTANGYELNDGNYPKILDFTIFAE